MGRGSWDNTVTTYESAGLEREGVAWKLVRADASAEEADREGGWKPASVRAVPV